MIPKVVYHWWSEEQPAYSDMAHPVVLSIATLRAVNKDIPIIVLDCSSQSENEWGHFPKLLNFHVIKHELFLKKNYSHIKGYELLSRLFDLRRNIYCQGSIIYCDSDVFWLRDPLPLLCDHNKFCFDGYNSGFMYYNSASQQVQSMFDVFEAYTIAAINDNQFRQRIKSHANYDSWPHIWDEIIMSYMIENGHRDLFNIIPREEHVVARTLSSANKNAVKMFHCNGMMMRNPIAPRYSQKLHSRGIACLLFKEFYRNMCETLDESDIEMIFSDAERQHYLSQQLSLLEEGDRLEKTKTEDGHYHLQTMLRPPAFANMLI